MGYRVQPLMLPLTPVRITLPLAGWLRFSYTVWAPGRFFIP